MRFKIDENLPAEAVEELARAGYEADTVAAEGLAGADDATIAEVLQRERRVLVTFDLDFANLRRYPPQEYPGLVVLRLRTQSKSSALAAVRRVVAALASERLDARLWIVEERTLRIHD